MENLFFLYFFSIILYFAYSKNYFKLGISIRAAQSEIDFQGYFFVEGECIEKMNYLDVLEDEVDLNLTNIDGESVKFSKEGDVMVISIFHDDDCKVFNKYQQEDINSPTPSKLMEGDARIQPFYQISYIEDNQRRLIVGDNNNFAAFEYKSDEEATQATQKIWIKSKECHDFVQMDIYSTWNCGEDDLFIEYHGTTNSTCSENPKIIFQYNLNFLDLIRNIYPDFQANNKIYGNSGEFSCIVGGLQNQIEWNQKEFEFFQSSFAFLKQDYYYKSTTDEPYEGEPILHAVTKTDTCGENQIISFNENFYLQKEYKDDNCQDLLFMHLIDLNEMQISNSYQLGSFVSQASNFDIKFTAIINPDFDFSEYFSMVFVLPKEGNSSILDIKRKVYQNPIHLMFVDSDFCVKGGLIDSSFDNDVSYKGSCGKCTEDEGNLIARSYFNSDCTQGFEYIKENQFSSNDNYFGCLSIICFDKEKWEKDVCSGHGTCTGFDTCECYSGFGGSDCSVQSNLVAFTIIVGSLIALFILIFIVLCAIIVSIFFCLLKQKKNLKKFEDIEDVDIILQEQKLSKDHSMAHFNINKKLFEIETKDIQILQKIGSGGSSATIFSAMWNQQKVAYKCFEVHDYLENEKYREFEKEVELLASISFPFILKFYGASLNSNRLGFIMEFAENEDLQEFLQKYKKKNSKSYPFLEKIRMIKEMSSAILFLHNKSIIHRDLKLQNVLVTANEETRIMDFGLSRIIESDTTKTKKIGTSIYMAPEVLNGQYSFPCDVFSFSIMLFVMFSENFYPYGVSTNMIETKVARDPKFRPNIQELEGKISDELIELIVANWNVDPSKRMNFTKIAEHFSKLYQKKEENKEKEKEKEEKGKEKEKEVFSKAEKESMQTKIDDLNKTNVEQKKKIEGFEKAISELKKQLTEQQS